MAVARILARLGIDITQFQVGLTKANQSVDTFARGSLSHIGGMIGGAFAAGSIIEFTRRTGEAAEQTLKVSKAIGISTDEFQALANVAKRTGSSVDSVAGALAKLRKAQGGAQGGSKELIGSFKEVGLEGAAIQDTAKALDALAIAAEGASEDSAKFLAVTKILGKNALPELSGVLDEIKSKGGLNAVIGQERSGGRLQTRDQLESEARAKEHIETSMQTASGFGARLLSGVLSFVEKAASIGGMATSGSRIDANTMADILGTDNQRVSPFVPAPKETRNRGAYAGGDADRQAIRDRIEQESIDRSQEEVIRQRRLNSPEAKAAHRFSAEGYDKMLEDEKDAQRTRRRNALDIAHAGDNIRAGSPQAANALARIGGTIGRQTDPQRQIAERQLKVMESIARVLAHIAERQQVKDQSQ